MSASRISGCTPSVRKKPKPTSSSSGPTLTTRMESGLPTGRAESKATTTSPSEYSPRAMPLTRASFSFSARPRSYWGSGITCTPAASTTARWASLTTACASFLRARGLPRKTSSGSKRSPTYNRWSKVRFWASETATLISSR